MVKQHQSILKNFWHRCKYGILLSIDLTLMLFAIQFMFPYREIYIINYPAWYKYAGLCLMIYGSYSFISDLNKYLSEMIERFIRMILLT